MIKLPLLMRSPVPNQDCNTLYEFDLVEILVEKMI